MAFKFLSTVQTLVKRFNSRIKSLAKQFGKDSSIVQDIASKMDVLTPNNYRFKDGIPQMTRPSDFFKNEELSKQLQDMLDTTPTYKELRSEYKEQYQQYSEQEKFFGNKPISEKKFIVTMQSLPSAISWLYPTNSKEQKKALAIMKEKGRRKTYAELQKVVNLSGR